MGIATGTLVLDVNPMIMSTNAQISLLLALRAALIHYTTFKIRIALDNSVPFN